MMRSQMKMLGIENRDHSSTFPSSRQGHMANTTVVGVPRPASAPASGTRIHPLAGRGPQIYIKHTSQSIDMPPDPPKHGCIPFWVACSAKGGMSGARRTCFRRGGDAT